MLKDKYNKILHLDDNVDVDIEGRKDKPEHWAWAYVVGEGAYGAVLVRFLYAHDLDGTEFEMNRTYAFEPHLVIKCKTTNIG